MADRRGYKPGSSDIKPDIVAAQRSTTRDKAYEVESQPWDAAALGLNKLSKGVPAYNSDDPKLALEENELKKFHQAMKKAGEDHRAPRDIIWEQCWNIYNNEFDWSQKAWWQHKAPIPKVRVAVDRAVALFRKTLLKMNPFYGLKAETKLGRTKGRYTMLLDDYHFDKAKVLNELVVAFKVGLITSVAATKIFWQRTRDFKPQVYTDIKEVPTYEFGVETGKRQESTKRVEMESYYKGSLGFMALNPSNIWVIPGTRNRCIIERSEATLNEIQSLIKDTKHPDGIYESEAVGRLKEKALSSGMSYGDSDNSNQTLEGQPQSNTYLRKVVLEHYWGDIYDTSGNLVMCDASYTFAGTNSGDEILIRKPRSNPFYHKDPPYIIGTPYVTPFSTYNRGMVEDVMEIAKAIVEMSNLIADGALYDALKAFAIDADQLDSPEEAKNGLYPGKTFVFHSGQAASPNAALVQTVNVGRIPQEANNMIALFEKHFQEGSFINEWVAGSGSKTDRTLGEVNIKTQSALEGLDESARNLEVTLIEPSLEMATKVIYQFHSDYLLPRLIENYPQISMLLQDLTPAERYSIMVGDYSFEVKGLSLMVDRAQKIGEFKEILQLLSYLPGFIESLNPTAVLEEVIAPVGWDPNKIFLNPSQDAGVIPIPGQMPQIQLPPAINNRSQPPIQQANAMEGGRRGGAINNPMAAQQMSPQILQRMIQQRLMTMGMRPGAMGRPVI